MINSDSQSRGPICLPSICKHGRVFCSRWARVWHRTVQQQGTNSSKTHAGFYVSLSACIFFLPGPVGFSVKKVFGIWRARSPSPWIMAGCAAGLTQLLPRSALQAGSRPAAPSAWTSLLESTQHPGKLCIQTKLPTWDCPSTDFFKSKWRGKMSSKATVLSFSPWLNLRAKFNTVSVFRSGFSFAICFPLQCWANGRRDPAAEEKKKKFVQFKFLKSFPSYSDKISEWKYIPVIDITWT